MAELLLAIYTVKGNNFEGESMYKLLSKYKRKKIGQAIF
jgi:PII-like signaling protein